LVFGLTLALQNSIVWRRTGLVMQISYLGKRVYLCEICAHGYTDETTANDCESYCKIHGNPSAHITKRAALNPE
jgi:hypothetical protein